MSYIQTFNQTVVDEVVEFDTIDDGGHLCH